MNWSRAHLKWVRNMDAAWHAENDADQYAKIVAISTSRRKAGYLQREYDILDKKYNSCRSTTVVGGRKFFSLLELL